MIPAVPVALLKSIYAQAGTTQTTNSILPLAILWHAPYKTPADLFGTVAATAIDIAKKTEPIAVKSSSITRLCRLTWRRLNMNSSLHYRHWRGLLRVTDGFCTAYRQAVALARTTCMRTPEHRGSHGSASGLSAWCRERGFRFGVDVAETVAGAVWRIWQATSLTGICNVVARRPAKSAIGSHR